MVRARAFQSKVQFSTLVGTSYITVQLLNILWTVGTLLPNCHLYRNSIRLPTACMLHVVIFCFSFSLFALLSELPVLNALLPFFSCRSQPSHNLRLSALTIDYEYELQLS